MGQRGDHGELMRIKEMRKKKQINNSSQSYFAGLYANNENHIVWGQPPSNCAEIPKLIGRCSAKVKLKTANMAGVPPDLRTAFKKCLRFSFFPKYLDACRIIPLPTVTKLGGIGNPPCTSVCIHLLGNFPPASFKPSICLQAQCICLKREVFL